MRQITRGIAVGAILLLAATGLFAQTDVGGSPITSDQTWDLAGSPYRVIGDVFVDTSATLTIEAGVTVQFTGPFEVRIKGILHSNGALPEVPQNVRVEPDEVNWVTFTQDTTGLAMDQRWKGIRFDNAKSGSVIEWTIIEFGYARGEWPDNNGGGLYVKATSPRIEGVVLRANRADNFGGGAYIVSSASTFRNNLIVDNYADVSGGGLYLDLATIPLHNVTVVNNIAGATDGIAASHGNGVYFGPGINPYIRSSIFYQNQHVNSDDEGYFNAGQNTSSDPEIRASIDTSFPQDDIANQVFSDPDEAGFKEFFFYTLSDSSIGVDGGILDNDRWVNEPTPNGGPNGGRINMGAFGGTQLGAKSLPVAMPLNTRNERNSRVIFQPARPGESTSSSAQIINIGAGLLTLRHDSLRFMEAISEDRFEIPYFQPMNVRPDSLGAFEIIYHASAGDSLLDSLEIGTNGGPVRFGLRALSIDPLIEVDITPIDFGVVNIGEPESRELIIGNSGTSALTCSFSYRTGNFDEISQITIAPGEEDTVTVVCDPISTGPISDILRIGNTDSPRSIELNAYGRGAIPEVLWPLEDEIDFAFVNVDDTAEKIIVMRNNGNEPLVIDSVYSSNSMFTTDFESFQADSALTDTLVVSFTPTELNIFADTLRIYSPHRSWTYYLSGRGTEGGVYFSGDIPSEENRIPDVWGANGETVYVCAGPSTIPPGESLTILPGVRVLFESNDFIQIEGTIEVLGVEGDSVYFEPLFNQRHGGLRFLASSAGTRMKYAVIDSARSWTLDEINDYFDYSTADGNLIRAGEPHYLAHGGGLSIYNCNPTFTDIAIRNSFSNQDGGGMWIYQAAPTLINVDIENNEATGSGGGAYFWGSAPNFHASSINNNVAGLQGGGVYFKSYSNALFTNNVVHDNLAHGWGGAAYVTDHSNPLILNNVLYSNQDDSLANGLYAAGASRPIIRNTVLWETDGESIVNLTGTEVIARYSVIQGGFPAGTNILDTDPMLDLANGYVPLAGSPLIDAGDPAEAFEDYSFPPSQGEARGDIGITGGPYAAYIGGAVLRMAVFRNPASPRGLQFVINGMQALDGGAPQVTLTTFNGEEDLSVSTVDNTHHIWRAPYVAEESVFFEVEASGAVGGELVSTRRRGTIALFKTATGGLMNLASGARLVLPPYALSQDVVLLGQAEISTNLPEEASFASIAAERFNISGPAGSWSEAAELVVPYDDQVVMTGRERGLSVWRHTDGSGWQQLNSSVEPDNKTVHATVDGPGSFVVLYQTTSESSDLLPQTSVLGNNYPNPFNPTTTIPFNLRGSAELSISVFNVLGQKVATVTHGWYTAGQHNVVWDGRDISGHQVASGVYLYRMETHPADGSKGITQTRKLVLMR
ncbi:choice-of-anchor D domain-containing protein [bacterium]|nr:choice-of-anchor D domain-containing protein [bacterium]